MVSSNGGVVVNFFFIFFVGNMIMGDFEVVDLMCVIEMLCGDLIIDVLDLLMLLLFVLIDFGGWILGMVKVDL